MTDVANPLPPGRIRERPEDFVVDEIPAYAPSGEGEHVFVRFTKTGVTTFDAVRAIADMQVRGAPLIGVTAAWGLALAMNADPGDAHLAEAAGRL